MIKGSCCCGAIKFELANPPSMMGTCHCSRCRKLGASVFVFVKKADFSLIQGAESIERFKPVAPYKYSRTFCRVCGTALGEVGSTSDSFPIAANCLDDAPMIENSFHEFVSEKPTWYKICDDVKQFSHHPNFGQAK